MTTASSNNYLARLRSLRLPKVCVAVTGTDAADMLQKAESLTRDNSLLELRLDYHRDPASALPKIKRFIEYYPNITAIATCRREANGGKFRGSVASQLELADQGGRRRLPTG